MATPTTVQAMPMPAFAPADNPPFWVELTVANGIDDAVGVAAWMDVAGVEDGPRVRTMAVFVAWAWKHVHALLMSAS